jgi:aryl-phospho-beta-D-glucosidase BglC (GH1 family)
VRLPVGYWNVIEDPYHRYAPKDHTKALKYIDLCFDWAEKYGLTVLLDLHGAPGSQNGIDHRCARILLSYIICTNTNKVTPDYLLEL